MVQSLIEETELQVEETDLQWIKSKPDTKFLFKEKKLAKIVVKLPEESTRKVWTKPDDPIMGETLAEEKDLQWTKTKPDTKFLFKEKKSATIVVKLPPRS
ncbi:hypothetical protein PtrSN002B_010752 [Pyrenophora tritici-repentis]|uniref:Transformer domain containing protein n=1 Tax=Pyrenophora tritici-repentis TaxID=45151 RepID=A0A2W1EM76_9PLEO|nr:hypothetical protein PtrV1_06065 [Pyrenophora tritici-repentis]KAF7450805.1 hypothetical protein A1F99_054210 [Pyrenophora tritici-repentis]KAF7573455.1 Transformer domain containing protein [Pyrenophora tritici-repentis]KAG9380982.1 hypothetical protein A1F94_008302 [Pyrenophora tritici-repentis]KAI0577114.1 hypothetical protein Alg215_07092 [Pyrenophora tritici-repentis]